MATANMKVLNFDENSSIRSLVHDGRIYLSSRDLCNALGYNNTAQALNKNCSPEYIVELQNIPLNLGDLSQKISPTVEGETALQHSNRMKEKWLEEPAAYELISQSKRPEAKQFRRWLHEEVLPTLRKTGSYTTPTRNNQVQLINETDLHYKIVEFIRKRYPDVVLIAGLGELQTSSESRIDAWRKGYTKGQPDLMLPVKGPGRKNGLALELKSPGWQAEASEHQKAFLRKLEEQGWQIKVSNCYEDLLFEVRDYLDKASKKRKRSTA